jgi:hypothetical protein
MSIDASRAWAERQLAASRYHLTGHVLAGAGRRCSCGHAFGGNLTPPKARRALRAHKVDVLAARKARGEVGM